MIPKIPEEYKVLLDQLKNITLLILTIIDLIFIVLSAIYTFPITTEQAFLKFDLLVCILIFIDMTYEFITSKKGLREYFIKDKNIITLISILPIDLILFRYFMVFRLFRFIRIIRVVRVWHLKDNSSLRFFISNHLFNVLFIIFVLYTTLSSLLLMMFDDAFTSIGDGFWFTIITATTVGYGDITPASIIGKSITIFTIILGVIFVSVFTAYLSSIYDEQSDQETREQIEEIMQKNRKEIQSLEEKIDNLESKIDQLIEEK